MYQVLFIPGEQRYSGYIELREKQSKGTQKSLSINLPSTETPNLIWKFYGVPETDRTKIGAAIIIWQGAALQIMRGRSKYLESLKQPLFLPISRVLAQSVGNIKNSVSDSDGWKMASSDEEYKYPPENAISEPIQSVRADLYRKGKTSIGILLLDFNTFTKVVDRASVVSTILNIKGATNSIKDEMALMEQPYIPKI